jgi:rfaE bifunctional protein nucleotidyltransferase chain/domain
MRSKLVTRKSLAAILKKARTKGKRTVFTNGCFDILHPGHVSYLERAAGMGDLLVIGLNSDSSVKAIKGRDRPLNNERDRAYVLSALSFVDYITLFGENTPDKLIRMIRPDVLVKGGDWKIGDIVGGSFVKSYGGRVARIPFLKGYSTTSLIKKMRG